MALGLGMKEEGKIRGEEEALWLWTGESITQDPAKSDGTCLCLGATDRTGKSGQR